MNLLNEQLYQKNTLLKTYQNQNQRLKNIISREKSVKYLKFPKDGSLINRINDYEIQNFNIKRKLNETLMANTELINKAERQKMFNRKLQVQNESLKRKLIYISEKMQALNGQNLVDNIQKGIVNFSMLANLNDAKRYQQNLIEDKKLITQTKMRSNQNMIQSSTILQPQNLLTKIFSQSKIPIQQNDIVISTLNLQREKQQYLQEITYLKKQLSQTKIELQKYQLQVKNLKQKVLQLQQNNHSAFVLLQNDKLQGQLSQMQLIRSTLQLGLTKLKQQKDTRQKQMQDFKQSMSNQIHVLSVENQILRKTFLRQSLSRQNLQRSLRQSRKTSNNKIVDGRQVRRKNSEMSIKSLKSIKSDGENSRKNEIESRIDIFIQSQGDLLGFGNVSSLKDTKQKGTNDTKEKQSMGVNNINKNKNTLKQSTSLEKQDQYRVTYDLSQKQNLQKYSNSYQEYTLTKPIIKQTRVSFMLDDILQQENNNQQSQKNYQMRTDSDEMISGNGIGYQNSLMTGRGRRSSRMVEEEERDRGGFWQRVKGVFGG